MINPNLDEMMNTQLAALEKAYEAAKRDHGGCKHMSNESIAQSLPPASAAGRAVRESTSNATDAKPYQSDILKDIPTEPSAGTTYTAYLKKTALVTMSLEARLPDETTRLLSGNFEEADEAVSLFFGYMVACGFHPGSVTRAMRGFLDSCDE